jgi:CBS domain-containing protein
VLDSSVRVTPVTLCLTWLLVWNILLLGFNLVPAFPLDGGRIARSIVWRLTGSKQRGTRVAAQFGRAFSLVLGGVGVWLMISYGTFTGLWLIGVAFLLGQSARGALLQTAFSERIEAVRVADIMDQEPVAIPSGTSVAKAEEDYFLRYGWAWFPVVDESGRLVGIVRQEGLRAAGGDGSGTVAAAVEADGPGGCQVGVGEPLTEVLASEALRRLGAVLAVDGEGVLRGVVTAGQVRRALQSAFGAPVA